MAEEESELDQPLMLFGRDVRKIPCFRSSILCGVAGGIGTGLAVFMFTSKPRWASHSTMGSFVAITMSYFFYCRWDWAEQKYSIGQIQESYRQILAEREAQKAPVDKVEVVEVVDV